MANGRNKFKGNSSRDGTQFLALPYVVMDSMAFNNLSHPARSLLLAIARQLGNGNNGRLLASRAYLAPRGWKSADVIDRAKRELIAAGFLHETVKGCRPNKASWYAVTWCALEKLNGYDFGAAASFVRGAYQNNPLQSSLKRHATNTKNKVLCPSSGPEAATIVPLNGLGTLPSAPSDGTVLREMGCVLFRTTDTI